MERHEDTIFLLGRLEGKVDTLLANQASQANTIKELEIRVGKLENYKAYLVGISATIGALMSWLINYLRGGH